MNRLADYPEETAIAIRAAFGDEPIEQLSNLPGGHSGAQLTSFRAAGTDFVLRRLSPDRPWHRERLEREFACMAIASEAGIAPRVRYADAAAGVVIMERLPGTPIAGGPRGPAFTERLAESLRRLHEAPAFPAGPTIAEVVRFFDGNLRSDGGALPPTILPLMDEIADGTARFAGSAPCHNDLNPTNIVDAEGSIRFLDWDSACMGDPYFDLGELGVFVFPSQDQRSELLACYLRRSPSEEERARAMLGRVAALGFYAAAFFHISAGQEGPIDGAAALPLPELFAILASQPQTATPDVIGASLHREMLNEASTDRYAAAIRLLRGGA